MWSLVSCQVQAICIQPAAQGETQLTQGETGKGCPERTSLHISPELFKSFLNVLLLCKEEEDCISRPSE